MKSWAWRCGSLRSWSSRRRQRPGWRRWASWGSCSWARSRSWQCHEPPRLQQRSYSSEARRSLPESGGKTHHQRARAPHSVTLRYTITCPYASLFYTHVAAGHDSVSARADHGFLHLTSPPVKLTAGLIVHHRQQSLLKDVSDGTPGCVENTRVAQLRNLLILFLHKLIDVWSSEIHPQRPGFNFGFNGS